MINYSLKSCEDLIERYVNTCKGEVTTIQEGILGLGVTLLHSAEGKKSILIREYFINEWTSGHSITKYNKLPKKYSKYIGD